MFSWLSRLEKVLIKGSVTLDLFSLECVSCCIQIPRNSKEKHGGFLPPATITRPARKFIWLKSYVLLVLPSDPNIPNGILSTGANLKCLKRLREVQSGSISDDNAELVAKLDPAACAVWIQIEYSWNTKLSMVGWRSAVCFSANHYCTGLQLRVFNLSLISGSSCSRINQFVEITMAEQNVAKKRIIFYFHKHTLVYFLFLPMILMPSGRRGLKSTWAC